MTRATSSLGLLWSRHGLVGAAGLVYFLVLIVGFFYLRFPFSLLQDHLEAEIARTSDLRINAASRRNSFPFTLIWENLSLSGTPSPLESPIKTDQFLVDLELWPLLQGEISLPLLSGFNLRFYDGEQWVDEWATSRYGTLPEAVSVELISQKNGLEVERVILKVHLPKKEPHPMSLPPLLPVVEPQVEAGK